MDGNLTHLCVKLCQLLEIPYCINDIPKIKDLFEFSDLLVRNDIRSMVVDIPISTSIPTPAIVKYVNGEFAILTNQQNSYVDVYDPTTKKNRQFSHEEFDSNFSNSILLLETIEEKDIYKINIKNQKKSVLDYLLKYSAISILAISILLVTSLYSNLLILGISFLDLGCFIISLSAFFESHNFHNNVYQRLCVIKDKKGNSTCIQNGILSDLIPISFSSLSLLYTFMCLIFVLIYSQNTYVMYEWLLLIGIPFIIISLYRQIILYKRICVLCLVIIMLFLIKLIIYGSFIASDFTFSVLPDLYEFIIVLLSISVIYFFDQYVSLKNELRQTTTNQNNIWSKKQVIEKHIEKSDLGDNFIWDLKHDSITLISHLKCKYCLRSLKELLRLSLLNPEIDLKVLIKYESSIENDLMMKYFIEQFIAGNPLRMEEIYDDWKNQDFANYNNKDFDERVDEYFKLNIIFFNTQSFKEFPITLKSSNLIPNYIDAQNIKVAYAR